MRRTENPDNEVRVLGCPRTERERGAAILGALPGIMETKIIKTRYKDMEKIDLTKCNNCRFKAEISNSGPVSGRIVVDKGVCLVDGKGDFIGFLSLDGEEIMSVSGCGITDFEIVPRDPETYRDWQVGDVIYSFDDEGNTVSGEDEMCRVIFRSGELVAIAENYSAEEADINGCYTCSQLFREGWRLVLTDIEQKIIEEKKKYEPQDGDIVAWKDKEDGGNPAISIFRRKDNAYFTLFANGMTGYADLILAMDIVRPATEDEKQRLFDAMAKEGKRWNAEKKVVEDIPKPYEFKKGEPVLVRTEYGRDWKLAAYVELSSIPDAKFGKYGVTDGRVTLFYQFCLPYNERTMHLLGTNEDYKEE